MQITVYAHDECTDDFFILSTESLPITSFSLIIPPKILNMEDKIQLSRLSLEKTTSGNHRFLFKLLEFGYVRSSNG